MDIYGGIQMINPKELSTDELYFADKHYMSVSSFKKFQKCEVDGMREFGEMTSSMLIGSYIDAYVSNTLDKFKKEHPEIISSRGVTKGELKSEFKKADEICKYIDNDKTIQDFLSGDKQTVVTGEISNIPFKGKLDIYSKGIAINDLKIMQSITDSNGEYYDFITKWGYHYQMGVYQELIFQNTGEKLPCFIVAVTKETPVNSAIIEIPQTILDVALYDVESKIQRFYDIKMGTIKPIGCGKCASCISKRKSTPIISMSDFISC